MERLRLTPKQVQLVYSLVHYAFFKPMSEYWHREGMKTNLRQGYLHAVHFRRLRHLLNAHARHNSWLRRPRRRWLNHTIVAELNAQHPVVFFVRQYIKWKPLAVLIVLALLAALMTACATPQHMIDDRIRYNTAQLEALRQTQANPSRYQYVFALLMCEDPCVARCETGFCFHACRMKCIKDVQNGNGKL